MLLDKEAAEHLSIHDAMSNERVLLCNFHSITAASNNVPKVENSQDALEAFCSCIWSKTKEEFAIQCAKLLNIGPATKVT